LKDEHDVETLVKENVASMGRVSEETGDMFRFWWLWENEKMVVGGGKSVLHEIDEWKAGIARVITEIASARVTFEREEIRYDAM
jgi:lauroyl/myristoyl acyltransferase